jgi:dephospho-CoA kinase
VSGRAGRKRGILNVGLTGNVASGKSTVARQWARAGIAVVSADELSRQVVAPGKPGLARVVEAFGEDVLADDGSLDRAAVRARVFSDPEERRRLEAILHPLITQRRARWLEEREAEGYRLLVSEIPLLFEVGLEGEFDRVVVVHTSAEERLRRLVEGRGLDPDEARRIMQAQGDPEEKRRQADHVLGNDGTPEELARTARALLDRLAAEAEETMVLDLHLHTRGSWDCLSDPEEVLERALNRGVHRIAITDHDRLGVAVQMARRHPGLVIPGEEVKTAEGVDVIGLYLTDEIPGGTPAREVIRQIHAQGGLAYLPHPYASRKGRSGRLADELASRVDVVEAFNARLQSVTANRRAEALARRHGRLRGAGSDAHTVGEVGNGRVLVPWHAHSAEALADALSLAQIEGERAPLRVFLASNWAKVRKRLPM